jgi:hypothetical protein
MTKDLTVVSTGASLDEDFVLKSKYQYSTIKTKRLESGQFLAEPVSRVYDFKTDCKVPKLG